MTLSLSLSHTHTRTFVDPLLKKSRFCLDLSLDFCLEEGDDVVVIVTLFCNEVFERGEV